MNLNENHLDPIMKEFLDWLAKQQLHLPPDDFINLLKDIGFECEMHIKWTKTKQRKHGNNFEIL